MKKFVKTVLCLLLVIVIFACSSCAKKDENEIGTNTAETAMHREGNYYYFGRYPQSQVKDSSLKGTLDSIAGDTSTWTSYGYYIENNISDFMKYKDVSYGGNKYRGVYFTSYRPDRTYDETSGFNKPSYPSFYFQDDNGYVTGSIYWFKYEPIKWKIVSETSSDAFLVADLILDSQDYHYTGAKIYGVSPGNYEKSHIREWLNSNFYDTAFTDGEKSLIRSTAVDNSKESTDYSGNEYACADTNDKIFLLSHSEIKDSNYGFDSDSSRKKAAAAYAKCQGVHVDSNGYSCWWIRPSGDDSSFMARIVDADGRADYVSDVFHTYRGVVPALHLTLG